MAKRSREDFELSSPESEASGDCYPTARSVVHPRSEASVLSFSKFVHLEPDSGEAKVEMHCSLPPHRGMMAFLSYEDFDVHYAKVHTNRCVECRKNFPTEHFLNLHIEENHDAMVSVLRERGEKTYACFVEDCDRKCSSPQKRKMHLIDKHMFPKDYHFFVVNEGIDRRSSMLRSGHQRRRSSAQNYPLRHEERTRWRASTEGVSDAKENLVKDQEAKTSEAAASNSPEDDPMDGLSGAMSALRFVPPSVRFGGRGRGRGRGGFSRT